MNEILKNNNLKSTRQRLLILNVIKQLDIDATLKNIVEQTKKDLDKSTVYRIIDLFIEKGIIIKFVNYNEEVYYSLKESHNHYFVCVKCHKKELIKSCPIKEIECLYEDEKGYKILNHTVLINGICKNCQKT